MLIAHLPSGYILGAFARSRWRGNPGIMAAALAGSVAPDLDMLYFHLVDGGRTHHHAYVTHWPLFWMATGLMIIAFACWRAPRYAVATGMFFAAGMMHMVMDTVASPILWLMPFSRQAFELVAVPASYSHWVISFVLHWTFALELLICAAALGLAFHQSRSTSGTAQNGS